MGFSNRHPPRAPATRGGAAPWSGAAPRTVVILGLGLTALAGPAGAGERAGSDERICAEAIAVEERRQTYPADLLLSIAIVESGRSSTARRTATPWPWTVTANGRGRYFSSQAAAAAAIRRLQGKGIESIDVGCMQVNLYYHPDAFASVEDALDPQRNVAYAASFLTDLASRSGSWLAAVGRYHSGTAHHAQRYRMKVLAARAAHRRHRRGGPGAHLPKDRDGVRPAVRDAEGSADDRLPSVLRGTKRAQAPARVFAPGRIVLPIILRGERADDTAR